MSKSNNKPNFVDIKGQWRFLRFGAFLIAERRQRSNVLSDRHGWHTVITELSRCTHGWPRLHYVGTRFRRGYARCSHEYTRWGHGYLRISAVALRIFAFSTRVSRKHYGYYVFDGSHTVCRRFWYCGTPRTARKSVVWATAQNRGCCSF